MSKQMIIFALVVTGVIGGVFMNAKNKNAKTADKKPLQVEIKEIEVEKPHTPEVIESDSSMEIPKLEVETLKKDEDQFLSAVSEDERKILNENQETQKKVDQEFAAQRLKEMAKLRDASIKNIPPPKVYDAGKSPELPKQPNNAQMPLSTFYSTTAPSTHMADAPKTGGGSIPVAPRGPEAPGPGTPLNLGAPKGSGAPPPSSN